MTNKIATAAATAALLVATVTPAFAGGGFSVSYTKIHNAADVDNNVHTSANTGKNEIGGKYVFGGKISTGDAWASSTVVNDVNSTDLGNCGCSGIHTTKIHNWADVDNRVTTSANSGDNEIHGQVVAGGKISTGDAGAEAGVVSVVNSTTN